MRASNQEPGLKLYPDFFQCFRIGEVFVGIQRRFVRNQIIDVSHPGRNCADANSLRPFEGLIKINTQSMIDQIDGIREFTDLCCPGKPLRDSAKKAILVLLSI